MDEELKTEESKSVRLVMRVIKNVELTESYGEVLDETERCVHEDAGVKSQAGSARAVTTASCSVQHHGQQIDNNKQQTDNNGEQTDSTRDCRAEDEKENHISTVMSVPERQRDTDKGNSGSTEQLDSETTTTSAPPQILCDDEEVMRKAREEGQVDITFPGSVTQDGCCRFVCELLKCVLYQRQQLPMTYDQMVFFQKQQRTSVQPEDGVTRRSTKTSESHNWQRCQRTLQELDDVLGHLETLFSLTHVPRVLFMLGGSPVLPVELYDINMEALVVEGGEKSLRTSTCLRQLFRTLFVADLLSDVKPVRIMPTTIMALGHRDCGVGWFKPKLNFKVPARVKRQIISFTSDTSANGLTKVDTRDWEDYIWFQAPVTVKGFCK